MAPFSPDRTSSLSGTAVPSSPTGDGISKEPVDIQAKSSQEDTLDPAAAAEKTKVAAGGDVEADTVSAPATVVSPVLADTPPPHCGGGEGGGGGGANSSAIVKEFSFSDDDEGSSPDRDTVKRSNRRSAQLKTAESGQMSGNGKDDSGRGGANGKRDEQQADISDNEQAPRDERFIFSGSEKGGGESADRHRQGLEELRNPSGSQRGRHSREGGQESSGGVEGVASAVTPASSTWVPPDFGFSSEDEEGPLDISLSVPEEVEDPLDLDLSLSELSSSRQAEGTGEDEQNSSTPLSPVQGSAYGFDSSSAAS